MSASNEFQPYVLNKVRELHHQAIDARTEGRYADQEAALREALIAVGPLDAPLPLRIKETYWLADALRMQGEYKKAMIQYSWLIDLAPIDDVQKSNNNSLYYFAGAYIYFVECGRYAPHYFLTETQEKVHQAVVVEGEEKAFPLDMAEAQARVCQKKIPEKAAVALQNKINEGLLWLKQIRKPDWWSAGLYLQQGLLLKNQASYEEAEEVRKELLKKAQDNLQTALDYARESTDAPGYTFPTYQLELADLCCDIGLYAKAIDLAEEVLASADSNTIERQRAYKILIYARLEKEDMAAMHFLPLKDQSLDASIKSTETTDNHMQEQLRLIKELLVNMSTAQSKVAPAQPGTIQETQPENPVNMQVEQLRTSVNELISNNSQVTTALSKTALEQAMSINTLLQKQSAVQPGINTTHEGSIQAVSSPDSTEEKEGVTKAASEHIVCLVTLPSEDKEDKFHKVLLPALRRVLELHPYYWQVVCENERIYENIEQLNFLAWLNRAQVYIADISSGSFKVMIELGAMLSAKKPGQPLLVFQEEEKKQAAGQADKSKPNFADVQDMVGMIFEYPPNDSEGDKHDVNRVVDSLEEYIQSHEGISELNKGKHAHYLSPLFFSTMSMAPRIDIAEMLSRKFITMEEALVQIDKAAFRHWAKENNLEHAGVEMIKKAIMECLNIEEAKGAKND